METSFRCVDLFAGIGGFRLAFESLGGECVGYSEINKDAIATYTANFPTSEGSNLGDITQIKNLPPHDLLAGGVPCQSWSIAGRNLGFDDDRGQLWNDAIFLLGQAKPKAFLFENVKGLADPRNRKALDYIMHKIKVAGYFAKSFVINSFDYGVPQSRVRIYIVGFRDEKFANRFVLPPPSKCQITLGDILENFIAASPALKCQKTPQELDLFGNPVGIARAGGTSLSTNNNGYNDYFLLNDIRNGCTTIHSWDILETTDRQKEICLLLLRQRRKSTFGPLDGNPLSLSHFQGLDNTITAEEIHALVALDILKPEKYAYRVKKYHEPDFYAGERLVLSFAKNGILITDELAQNRELKIQNVSIAKTLANLEEADAIECIEERYDFKNTKISMGLFGVCRIFLPTSNIFPTLVASDSSDYVTETSIPAKNGDDYKKEFLETVLKPKRYRRISHIEACRIQGFPDSFILPESRSRWMKLLGNSVSVPVIRTIAQAICETGIFDA